MQEDDEAFEAVERGMRARSVLEVEDEQIAHGRPADEALLKHGAALEEEIFRALAQRTVWRVQSANSTAAETGTGVAVHESNQTPAEKIAALEKVNRAIGRGMADFDTSGIFTHGRVSVTPRPAEILEFPAIKKPDGA
jgi:hypothetical protein